MLDELDRSILELLQRDGRMAYSVMARTLDSNEATVRKRTERLIRDGVVNIIGVSNPYQLGLKTHILIGMDVDLIRIDEIADELSELDEFNYVACASGQYDLVAIGVFASDIELYHFLSQRLPKIEGIRKTYTSHLLRLKRRTFNYRIPGDTNDISAGDRSGESG
jgi:Lrp/AsnC family transcriptional regulator, regulator for asnA, asnC and gidA